MFLIYVETNPYDPNDKRVGSIADLFEFFSSLFYFLQLPNDLSLVVVFAYLDPLVVLLVQKP